MHYYFTSMALNLLYLRQGSEEEKTAASRERSVTTSSIYTIQPDGAKNPTPINLPGQSETHPSAASGQTTLQEVTDQARLSSLTPTIRAALNEMTGENNVLNTLADNVERLQDGFIETLYTTLSEGDVDLSQKMTLRLGDSGSLVVAGEHPEKDQVEKLLAKDPALANAFSEIAAQSEVLRSIANIGKVMTRQTGMNAYTDLEHAGSASTVYQMSLKGEMSHFYFSHG